jgi:hypothetical protein
MARSCRYIEAQTFHDFKENQEKLIEILNHNMTKIASKHIEMGTDIRWIKKIMNIQTGILSGTFIAILGLVIKLVVG